MSKEKETKDINEPLAFGYWPIGSNKKYRECDLDDEKAVEMLFDYAQVLEVNVTCKGWNYLIKRYGFEKLFEIDKRSGWFDGDNVEEYKSWVELQMSYI